MAHQKVIVDGLTQDDVTKAVAIDHTILLANLEHFVVADVAQYKVEKVRLYRILFDIDTQILSVLGIDSKGNHLTIRSEADLFSTGEEVKLRMQEDLEKDVDDQIDLFNQGKVEVEGD